MGVVFFVVYYVLFRLVIRWWNLRTPGREPDDEFEAEQAANLTDVRRTVRRLRSAATALATRPPPTPRPNS